MSNMVSLKADIPPSKAVAAQETVRRSEQVGRVRPRRKNSRWPRRKKSDCRYCGKVRVALREALQGRGRKRCWIGQTLAEMSAKGPQQPALRAGSTMTKVRRGNSLAGLPRPGRC